MGAVRGQLTLYQQVELAEALDRKKYIPWVQYANSREGHASCGLTSAVAPDHALDSAPTAISPWHSNNDSSAC
jgi:hypothetical protein